MLKSVKVNFKCRCGTTSKGIVPDENNRIAIPEMLCVKCKDTCETYVSEPAPKEQRRRRRK